MIYPETYTFFSGYIFLSKNNEKTPINAENDILYDNEIMHLLMGMIK